MSNFDSLIFGKKKYSDLMKEIYDNSKQKQQQIVALIGELKPLINDIGDATLIVPLIKEYMEVGVKNDEHLIKLAAIIQRSLQNSTDEGNLSMTDEEKDQLMQEIEKLNKQ